MELGERLPLVGCPAHDHKSSAPALECQHEIHHGGVDLVARMIR